GAACCRVPDWLGKPHAALGHRRRTVAPADGDLSPRRRRPTACPRRIRDLPGRSALEGPRPLLRVFPRRQWRWHRREPPDGLDRARRQAPPAERSLSMLRALEQHWPEYLAEALGLGLFMLSACVFGTLLGHPASPAARAIPDGFPRRLLMGLAMGLTAV